MKMRIIGSKKEKCICCMKEHEIKTVEVDDSITFKNTKVKHKALYCYCDRADELFATEEQMSLNDISMKDAYRVGQGLLSSKEILSIRSKYDITQSDLCTLLGWGGKTITRYESSQVQDKAHDTILRKIDNDPEWFIDLLEYSKDNLSYESYKKYKNTASILFEKEHDKYLIKSIEASYARYEDDAMSNGNVKLSIDKVVEIIRYLAASKNVIDLYKVKLMKVLWYIDALSYKERGSAITGLVYKAFPMGAVPIGHETIIDLHEVPCEEVIIGEGNGYHFQLKEKVEIKMLTKEEKDIVDKVIKSIGKMSKDEIVAFMHNEVAYKETAQRDVIQFKYAMSLQI